jgi:acetylornithine deacetylase/succinyl-diaminopimelate desuccinylase-like protein
MPREYPGNRAAHRVLAELYQREPYYTRLGGTLPVCDLFLRNLAAYTVFFDFALEDEQFHAPDEFFRLSSFKRGQQAYCLLLEQLGR